MSQSDRKAFIVKDIADEKIIAVFSSRDMATSYIQRIAPKMAQIENQPDQPVTTENVLECLVILEAPYNPLK